jgi:hypothetical protein
MPTKSTEDMKWIKEVAPFVFVETIAESNVLEISARHLRASQATGVEEDAQSQGQR